MPGLNERDMGVLRHYAEQGNRELYWNYLARIEGNDRYGLLAMGVVRNDNMPGAVANAYAQNYASQHNNKRLDEREWERFGEDLVRRDLERREVRMREGRPDLALNLPVSDVQRAHDQAFRNVGISPNAWTPRELLEAARRQGGEQAAEGVWDRMLNNAALGARRGVLTGADIARYDDAQLDAVAYTARMGLAYATATQMRSNVNPDVIGATSFYHMRDRQSGEWWSVSSGGGMGMPMMRRETNAGTIAELNETREVRLERQADSRRFHPDDPARRLDDPILRSPRTIAQNDTPNTEQRFAALDPHGIDLLPAAARQRLEQALAQARRLGLPEEDTQNLAMAMTRRIGDNATMRSLDDIVAVRGGADDGGVRVHLVYKPYGDRAPMFNDYVDVNPSVAVPARDNAQQIALNNEQRLAMGQQQDDRTQQLSGQQVG
jgi:hypothetical protein